MVRMPKPLPAPLLLECLIPGVSRSNVSFIVNGELTDLDAREGLLWVKSGSPAWASECPLLGVRRKSISGDWMSACSHNRTSVEATPSHRTCDSAIGGLCFPSIVGWRSCSIIFGDSIGWEGCS